MSIGHLERIADEVIPPILETARIPGMGIAAVSADELLLAKGYGTEGLGGARPITADTMYPIASTSKSMNATLIGLLVEEGRLAWDRPVQEYLPRFRLGDPLVSTQVTLRDLLCMRTGLPRHDWVWIESGSSRAQIMESIRHLELSVGFRQQFQYCNLSAIAAGHIAEVVGGRSWEELVRERLLEPLGMNATTFKQPPTGASTQSFHETDARELRATRRLATEVAAPSGGAIHSTVRDMARWAQFNLAPGSSCSPSIVRPETLAEIHSPQVVAGLPRRERLTGWAGSSIRTMDIGASDIPATSTM
jgi:CubicO group peptidase (beta-lactamase class C family)